MNFKPIKLEDKPVFDRVFRRRYYENSWFTFTNLLIWRDNYSTSWALQDESLYVRLQANGLIYFFSERGVCSIVHPDDHLNVIAENKLPGRILASPAVVGDELYIRTDKKLYCIGK